jgi:hypothetical protein
VAGYRGSDLEIVGRTVPMNPAQAAELAAVLKPGRCPASLARRGRRRPLGSPRPKGSVVKVRPVVVAEVAADPPTKATLPPSSAVPSFTGGHLHPGLS